MYRESSESSGELVRRFKILKSYLEPFMMPESHGMRRNELFPVHHIKKGKTMRTFIAVMAAASLLICLGCQKESPSAPQSTMKGTWTAKTNPYLQEVRHIQYLPDKNILAVSGVPVEGRPGLQFFNIADNQWIAPPENTPLQQIFTMSYNTGSALYAVMFSSAESAGQVLVSIDNGTSWSDPLILPENTDPRCVTLAGENSAVMLLGTINHGVYLSEDSGTTWMTPETPPDNPGIQGFAVDSGDPSHILAGTRIGLCESRDGGVNWQAVTNRFSNESVFVVEVVAHPRKAGVFTLIYRTAEGAAMVLRSTDTGQTWTPIRNGLFGDAQPRCVVFHPESDTTAYIGTVYDGIYKTESMGDQWVPINNGLPVEKPIIIHCMEFVPGTPGALMAGSNLDGQLFELTDY